MIQANAILSTDCSFIVLAAVITIINYDHKTFRYRPLVKHFLVRLASLPLDLSHTCDHIMVSSYLPHKYYIMVELAYIEKGSSLQSFGTHYNCKTFYNTSPASPFSSSRKVQQYLNIAWEWIKTLGINPRQESLKRYTPGNRWYRQTAYEQPLCKI